MIIGKLFAEELKKNDIDKLYVGHEKPELQHLAIKMLLRNYGLIDADINALKIKEEEGIQLFKGRGEEKVKYLFGKGGKKVELRLPKYPLIVIDMGLFDELEEEEEKKKTLLQVEVTLSVIRKWLWDGNLALIHSPPFSIGKAKIINEIESDNCIVLDPYGDTAADENMIRSTDVFIIGGIVDKGRRLKHATSKLAEKYNYPCKRVKIMLRDSIVGVPDEINKIVSIVLKVKYGGKLEDAIIENQSKSDKISRILRDLSLYGKEILEEEIRWLKVDDKTYKLVLSRLKH